MELTGLSGYRFADSQWQFSAERARALGDALGYQASNGRLPPTLPFSADMDSRVVDQLFALTGLGAHQLLHGEQHFHYHQPLQPALEYQVCRMIRAVDRKQRFDLLHTETQLLDAQQRLVCKMASIYVAIGHPSGPKTGPLLEGVECTRQGPVITRERIAAFAAASGDDNPVHLDPVIARGAGHRDVFAQGMLGMGLLGGLIPEGELQQFGVRFISPIPVDEKPCMQVRDDIPVGLILTGADGHIQIQGYAHVASRIG